MTVALTSPPPSWCEPSTCHITSMRTLTLTEPQLDTHWHPHLAAISIANVNSKRGKPLPLMSVLHSSRSDRNGLLVVPLQFSVSHGNPYWKAKRSPHRLALGEPHARAKSRALRGPNPGEEALETLPVLAQAVRPS